LFAFKNKEVILLFGWHHCFLEKATIKLVTSSIPAFTNKPEFNQVSFYPDEHAPGRYVPSDFSAWPLNTFLTTDRPMQEKEYIFMIFDFRISNHRDYHPERSKLFVYRGVEVGIKLMEVNGLHLLPVNGFQIRTLD